MTALAPAARTTRALPVFTALHDGLWRVTRPDGEVLGYLESFATDGGERYRAKRFLPTQRRFAPIGEFWRLDDARDCFRFS